MKLKITNKNYCATIVKVDNLKPIIRLNARPSKPDSRDLVYNSTFVTLPNSIDLRQYDSNTENQDNLGSCTANAITSGYEVVVKILYPEQFKELSRLFVYYHSRLFSDELDSDAGSYIRDGLKSIKNYGVCSEELWPYDIIKFTDQPYPRCYLDASKRQVSSYNILFTNDEIKDVLASKRPVVVGIEIFKNFDDVTKEKPFVSMPDYLTYSLGNHAVLIMGYDNTLNCFLIKNSYGVNWGDQGYAWIPYEYISLYAGERWCFDISNQSTNL
ncbi:MAG: C1 family peptidase [Minisyncoccia bacterium]